MTSLLRWTEYETIQEIWKEGIKKESFILRTHTHTREAHKPPPAPPATAHET